MVKWAKAKRNQLDRKSNIKVNKIQLSQPTSLLTMKMPLALILHRLKLMKAMQEWTRKGKLV